MRSQTCKRHTDSSVDLHRLMKSPPCSISREGNMEEILQSIGPNIGRSGSTGYHPCPLFTICRHYNAFTSINQFRKFIHDSRDP